MEVIKPEKKEESKTQEIKIEISIETIQKAFRGIGNTMMVAAEAFKRLGQAGKRKDDKETNNWRKMHGLPMRRKQEARKIYERRKRADSH